MQLLSLSSTEDGFTTGLGLIPEAVEEFSYEAVQGQKIPHVGFNQVTCEDKSRLLRDLDKDSDFYFVHSFRLPVPTKGKGIFIECNYGENFLAGYEHENIFATQFHPEKSQSNGLKLLANFLRA
jgi:glutamine amidotransferase